MDQALPPPPHHRRHGLQIPDGPRETLPHPLRECPRRWEYGLRLFGTASTCTTARLRWHACHFCADGPFITHSSLSQNKSKKKKDNNSFCDKYWPLAQPATATWCQGLVLFAREEAKRLLPIRCPRRGRRRRTNGSEGHQTEPFTWLPAERYFYPLLNSIGAYQRYTYRLRAVCDAQRQKLLLSGDIEQNPGPIAVLQMNVSCLTPSKLATLMAQGADIMAIQETWKSSEQIASMHTGDYVLYAQSRIGKGGGVAVLVR
ncbi:trans-sialidase, partial [Trypanosoma cruzi]